MPLGDLCMSVAPSMGRSYSLLPQFARCLALCRAEGSLKGMQEVQPDGFPCASTWVVPKRLQEAIPVGMRAPESLGALRGPSPGADLRHFEEATSLLLAANLTSRKSEPQRNSKMKLGHARRASAAVRVCSFVWRASNETTTPQGGSGLWYQDI